MRLQCAVRNSTADHLKFGWGHLAATADLAKLQSMPLGAFLHPFQTHCPMPNKSSAPPEERSAGRSRALPSCARAPSSGSHAVHLPTGGFSLAFSNRSPSCDAPTTLQLLASMKLQQSPAASAWGMHCCCTCPVRLTTSLTESAANPSRPALMQESVTVTQTGLAYG